MDMCVEIHVKFWWGSFFGNVHLLVRPRRRWADNNEATLKE
jgi:hypothetical protein